MNIASSTSVQAAVAATQAPQSGAVQIQVLRKALDVQEANAAALLQSIPSAPALATQGSVGTLLDTYA